MKEKSVTFCFLKLKVFCGKFTSLLSKLTFTHPASCWSHSQKIRKTKTLSPETERTIASRIAELLRLMVFRNEELLKLFTWVFTDLMIRGFELITCRFELVTRKF